MGEIDELIEEYEKNTGKKLSEEEKLIEEYEKLNTKDVEEEWLKTQEDVIKSDVSLLKKYLKLLVATHNAEIKDMDFINWIDKEFITIMHETGSEYGAYKAVKEYGWNLHYDNKYIILGLTTVLGIVGLSAVLKHASK